MLERLQSVLKTAKDYKPPSFMSHRFVTVRRGSPAARSGQIQPGDQLEAVEGRPVRGLQHRDLAQILRRAGNALRLSITPKRQGADVEIDSRMIKGSRLRPKDEPQFYSVDLDRGPTGFGFSLRGGSEYNMGLYVLGLMEGGPAQRSNKIQVSDQLVEINGDTTSGMTHSQAVEQIRRGGHRIHLVLKTGNGYVPDYDPEEGALSPSSSSHAEEQDVAPVTMTTTSPRKQMGHGERGEGKRRKMRREGETKRTGGGGERLGPPDLDLDLVEDEAQEKEKRRSQTVRQKEERETQEKQGRRSRSLPENAARSWHTSKPEERLEVEESGGGVRERRRRSAAKSRRRVTEEKREERDDITNRHTKHSGRSATTQRAVFSFLGPMDDNMESESAASFSDVSQSAFSVTPAGWEKEFDWRRSTGEQGKAPGPWLEPSPQRLTRVLIGSRLRGRELEGGLSL